MSYAYFVQRRTAARGSVGPSWRLQTTGANPELAGELNHTLSSTEMQKRGISGQNAVCDMKLGSFSCSCPPGEAVHYALIRGSIFASCIHPTTRTKRSTGIIVLSVASAVALVLLLLGAFILYKKVKARKEKKIKEKNFKKNRGMLLEKLVDKNIAESMVFGLEELEKATNGFDEARKLGGGGHGTVYKGILSNQQVVAIKKSKLNVQMEIDDFINEVAILSKLNHRNIIRLLGCCLETEVPLLVYEFIPNGTLSQHLHAEGPEYLSWFHCLTISAAIANALAYLHSSASTAIIHRDVKTDNILLDDRLVPKICDFGTSRSIPSDDTGIATAVQGSLGYLDPEYFQTNRLTEKSDVYSFGAVLVELLTRKKPFVILPSRQISVISHFNSLVRLGRIKEILDPRIVQEAGNDCETLAALAASCLLARGEERPTMRQLDIKLQEMIPARRTNSTRQVEAQDDEVVDEVHDEVEHKDCNDNDESTNRGAGSSCGQRTSSLLGAEAALALSLREAKAAFAKFRGDNDDYKLSKSRKLSLKKKCIGSEFNTERMSRGYVDLQLLNLVEQEKHLKEQGKHSLQGREEEDGMTKKDDPDDCDPLLEKGKQKLNKKQAKLKNERS